MITSTRPTTDDVDVVVDDDNNDHNIDNQSKEEHHHHTEDHLGGVPDRTETHTHYAKKDQLWYPTYELMAKANKLANEKRMKQLGLDRFRGSSSSTPTGARTPTTKRKSRAITPSPTRSEPSRRSKRLRKEPPAVMPGAGGLFTDDNDDDDEVVTKRLTPPKTKPLSRRALYRPVTPETKHLSASDRGALGRRYATDDGNGSSPAPWLRDMEEYLIEREGLSAQNHRTVMRQVTKLTRGVGVTYHHWGPSVTFARGERVDLSWDCQALFHRACEFEDEHGRDLGNGWLLRHPIKKIHNFQCYLLEQEHKGKK